MGETMSTTATRDDATQPAAPAAFSHREILTIMVGLMLAIFLASLDQTVVATAIRTIADDLHGFSLQAWATTAFLITSTITTPLYGKLSDIYGRKPFFLAAISIFIAGSALCGLSRSMYELAAFRAFQGLGAGGLFTLALTIIGDIVPPRERSKYQGYFLSTFAVASVLGPVIGGLLAGQSSIAGIGGWRWIFYVNVPIGLVTLVVVTRVLHLPHRGGARHRIDWPGALALVVCLAPLLTVAEQGRIWGWGSGRALACYAIGVAGLGAFLLVERAYAEDALLPLRLFRGRTFSVAGMNSVIVGMGMFGAIGLLPQYLQIVKESSPTVAGLQMIPLMLGIITGSVVAGHAIGRTGRYKIFPLVGAALMTVALVLFHLVGADTPLWRTMLVMVLFGLGVGGTMQPVVLAVQNAVSPRETGVATSSVAFFRQVGGTLGTAVFLSLLFSTLTGRITDATREAVGTPAFSDALRAHPDQARLLATGARGALTDTSFISRLDDVLARPFRVGFSASMDLVFLIAAGVVLIAAVVTLFLPQLPLRGTAGIQAERSEADSTPTGGQRR
jgi:EmrB/QacA subfamily drug resistance transporter